MNTESNAFVEHISLSLVWKSAPNLDAVNEYVLNLVCGVRTCKVHQNSLIDKYFSKSFKQKIVAKLWMQNRSTRKWSVNWSPSNQSRASEKKFTLPFANNFQRFFFCTTSSHFLAACLRFNSLPPIKQIWKIGKQRARAKESSKIKLISNHVEKFLSEIT